MRPPPGASIPGGPNVVQPERPGNYDVEMWKKVREGLSGQVSIPDKKAGQLVQSDGEAWRNFRNGPLPRYGLWAMAGIVVLLAVFLVLLRGRIAIEHGWAGRTITRFGDVERFGHWLLAVSFIILALTGLNVLYGRYFLLPLIGAEAFSAISICRQVAAQLRGLRLHGRIGPDLHRLDPSQLAALARLRLACQGWRHVREGLASAGLEVQCRPEDRVLAVMLGGLSLSLSGLALMFPFQTALFAKTFALVNMLGFNLPTQLTPVQEMQYATSWHGIVALALIVVIIAHIYIGTLGMQGAFSAMGSGQVDVNWAKEHHSLWAEREIQKMEDVAAAETGGRVAPAE